MIVEGLAWTLKQKVFNTENDTLGRSQDMTPPPLALRPKRTEPSAGRVIRRGGGLGVLSSLTVGVGLVLAGCTGGLNGSAENEPGSPGVSPSASSFGGVKPPVTPTGPAQNGSTPFPGSPFEPYLPYVNGPADDAWEVWADKNLENQNARQQFLAECMNERGFEYVAITPARQTRVEYLTEGDTLWLPYLPESEEVAKATGYGKRAPLDIEALMAPYRESGDKENQRYKESLSESARQAYNLALSGIADPFSGEGEEQGDSCWARADAVHPWLDRDSAEPGQAFRDQFGDLVRAMNNLSFDGTLSEPVVKDLNARWSQCMSNKGFDFFSESIFSPETITPWAAELMAESTLPNGQLGESWSGYLSLEDTPPEERSLLGSPREVEIAYADFQCRQESDYVNKFRQVQTELEQAFVDANRERLNAMVEFVTQNS